MTAAPSPTATAAAEAEAVGVIRGVRCAIDEFRDDRRDKLVRACNRLKATVFVTGLASLDDIFTINLPHLITAAIFGLAPGLLIDRLQQNTTEQYKRDLTSTQANATAG